LKCGNTSTRLKTNLYNRGMSDNTDRVLDWRPVYDKRSRSYPIRSMLPEIQEKTFTLWKTGEILDQGSEGACVGFGWTAEALAGPVQVNLSRIEGSAPKLPNNFARYVYREAQKIDEWPGESYDGTSVLAGAKVLARLGILHEYRWAFSVNDIIGTVMSHGPVVLGINWYQGMYSAPDGKLEIYGNHVGGHCIIVVGYNPNSEKFNNKETVILQNSWGETWGVSGLAEMKVEDLARLVREGGEACVPVIRGFRDDPKKEV